MAQTREEGIEDSCPINFVANSMHNQRLQKPSKFCLREDCNHIMNQSQGTAELDLETISSFPLMSRFNSASILKETRVQCLSR
jgi:hypothetical protein